MPNCTGTPASRHQPVVTAPPPPPLPPPAAAAAATAAAVVAAEEQQQQQRRRRRRTLWLLVACRQLLRPLAADEHARLGRQHGSNRHHLSGVRWIKHLTGRLSLHQQHRLWAAPSACPATHPQRLSSHCQPTSSRQPRSLAASSARDSEGSSGSSDIALPLSVVVGEGQAGHNCGKTSAGIPVAVPAAAGASRRHSCRRGGGQPRTRDVTIHVYRIQNVQLAQRILQRLGLQSNTRVGDEARKAGWTIAAGVACTAHLAKRACFARTMRTHAQAPGQTSSQANALHRRCGCNANTAQQTAEQAKLRTAGASR